MSGLAQTRIGIRQNQWTLYFRRLASIAVSGRISRCRPLAWTRQLAALNYLLKPPHVQSHDTGALRNVVCEALQPSKIQDQGRLSMSTRSSSKNRNFYRALPRTSPHQVHERCEILMQPHVIVISGECAGIVEYLRVQSVSSLSRRVFR